MLKAYYTLNVVFKCWSTYMFCQLFEDKMASYYMTAMDAGRG